MTVMMASGQTLPHEAPGGDLGSYPNFGMSMRFLVNIEGPDAPHDLGLWQSCSKLELDLHLQKFTQGGSNLINQWLPGNIDYSTVTLTRPMEKKSSEKVQQWLQKFINGWDSCSGPPYEESKKCQAIIRLLDHQLNEVKSWTLGNARPSKWIGPELTSNGTDVAIETLVIEHDGFLRHAEVRSQAKLHEKSDKDKSVEFRFNPATVTVSHASELKYSSDASKFNYLEKIGLLSLTIPELRLVGPDTLANCHQLLDWTYPAVKKPSNGDPYLSPLIFKWDDFSIFKEPVDVALTKATVKYERFDSGGKPIGALVDIELVCGLQDTAAQQNPTSGGLPGRSGHLMANGDTIPGIALGAYGDPGRWRAVAAANQIDDPLRVRPGSVLLLPNRTELAEGGAA